MVHRWLITSQVKRSNRKKSVNTASEYSALLMPFVPRANDVWTVALPSLENATIVKALVSSDGQVDIESDLRATDVAKECVS